MGQKQRAAGKPWGEVVGGVLSGVIGAALVLVVFIVGFDSLAAPANQAWRFAPGEVLATLAFVFAWGLGAADKVAIIVAAALMIAVAGAGFVLGRRLARAYFSSRRSRNINRARKR